MACTVSQIFFFLKWNIPETMVTASSSRPLRLVKIQQKFSHVLFCDLQVARFPFKMGATHPKSYPPLQHAHDKVYSVASFKSNDTTLQTGHRRTTLQCIALQFVQYSRRYNAVNAMDHPSRSPLYTFANIAREQKWYITKLFVII